MKLRDILRYTALGMIMFPTAVSGNDAANVLPKVERDGLEFYLYEVSKEESLYGISKRFDWDIDEIIAYNPEANGSLKKGFSLYYPTGKTIKKTAQVNSGIPESSLPELEEAKARNESLVSDNFKSGPFDNRKEETDLSSGSEKPEEDLHVTPGKLTDENPIEEIEESLTEIQETESIGGNKSDREKFAPTDPDRELRILLLVEDPTSKRESEFTKGMLMSLDAIKNEGKKVNLKIVQSPRTESSTEETLVEITDYQPELIFSTHEKNFPSWLLDYVNQGPADLVNVFDVKDDSFETNPGVIQMMTPSVSFSKDVADFASSRFRDRDLIVIGTTESADEVGSLLVEQWPGRKVDSVTPEMLAEMDFDDNRSYLLYVNVTTKNDINQLLTIICEKKQKYPLAEISVFGRANWIVYADGLSDKFFAADVYFPSRFYFESDSRRGKEFRSKFSTLFGHAPVKSFPMFSVAGYDSANYFLDALRSNGGDWNKRAVGSQPQLQAEIRLTPEENGGFVNPVCYVVRFAPFRMIDKMPLK